MKNSTDRCRARAPRRSGLGLRIRCATDCTRKNWGCAMARCDRVLAMCRHAAQMVNHFGRQLVASPCMAITSRALDLSRRSLTSRPECLPSLGDPLLPSPIETIPGPAHGGRFGRIRGRLTRICGGFGLVAGASRRLAPASRSMPSGPVVRLPHPDAWRSRPGRCRSAPDLKAASRYANVASGHILSGLACRLGLRHSPKARAPGSDPGRPSRALASEP
jgi:hypothetical protein